MAGSTEMGPLIHTAWQSKLRGRVSYGNNMAVGVFGHIAHCASMLNSFLFGFTQGSHYDYIDIVFLGIPDYFHIWRPLFNHEQVVIEIAQSILIFLCECRFGSFWDSLVRTLQGMLMHRMLAIGVRGVGSMQNVQLCIMFFGQVKGMKKGNVGVFGEICTEQYVFVFYHNEPLPNLEKVVPALCQPADASIFILNGHHLIYFGHLL